MLAFLLRLYKQGIPRATSRLDICHDHIKEVLPCHLVPGVERRMLHVATTGPAWTLLV